MIHTILSSLCSSFKASRTEYQRSTIFSFKRRTPTLYWLHRKFAGAIFFPLYLTIFIRLLVNVTSKQKFKKWDILVISSKKLESLLTGNFFNKLAFRRYLYAHRLNVKYFCYRSRYWEYFWKFSNYLTYHPSQDFKFVVISSVIFINCLF